MAICQECNTVNFPANVYGCRRCGAARERLEVSARPGRGVLRTFVTIHKPLVPGLAAPAVVGEVELAEGIVEEVVIQCDDPNALRPGMTLRAVAHEEVHEGETRLGCRFVPLEGIE